MRNRSYALLLITMIISASASAGQFVYPAKGQSADQQAKDEAACSSWATQQSGFDPSKPAAPPVAAAPAKPVGGGMLKGAAVGATVGAVAGNDVGHSAAVGAVVGGVGRAAKNKGAQQQQQQQANAQYEAGMEAHQKARAVCLEGRGYSVK